MRKTYNIVVFLCLTFALVVSGMSDMSTVKAAQTKSNLTPVMSQMNQNQTLSLTRTISKGKIKGKKINSGKTMVWYGIPYGATTAGVNRWKEPQPVASWSGTKKLTTKKGNAVRYSSTAAEGYTGTEDCLYVNVFRPYTKKTNLPVLVYLHSGGNTKGTANVSFQKMAAKMKVVIVSVSFRVGAFGYLSHSALRNGTDYENSGNFALLDIRAALQWVQSEIEVFGGNRDNVTLSGFSAGARNVLMCMASPIMKGLFHKAFVMSGGLTFCSPEEGEASVDSKLASVLVKRGTYSATADAKAAVDAMSDEEVRKLLYSLSTAEVAAMYKTLSFKLSNCPQCFTDGKVIPSSGKKAFTSGQYNRVPLLIGTDATEFSFQGWTNGLKAFGDSTLSDSGFSQAQSMIQKGIYYGSQMQSCFYLEEVASTISQDNSHQPIYGFRTMWGTDQGIVNDAFYSSFVGAYHGQTKNFLIGKYTKYKTEYSPNAISTANKSGRTALTSQMRSYLKKFMLYGTPNGKSGTVWSAWSSADGISRIMHFDANFTTTTSAMVSEQYDMDTIFRTMRANLTEDEYNNLINKVFANCYFMPDDVPAYR